MSFGYERQPRIFIHDTALLTAFLYAADDETLVPLTEIEGVTFSVRRPEDADVPAYIIVNTVLITANDPGAFGNSFTVEFDNPGVAGPLSATFNGTNLVVTLASDGVNILSTAADVVTLLSADPTIYPTLIATVVDNSPLVTGSTPMEPLVQTNLSHGVGPIIYRAAGIVADDGTATYLVPSNITNVPGEYLGMARFTLGSGEVKSVPCDFDCIDPFEDIGVNPGDGAVTGCWIKLEDCFDSELGGPWLRDMTMARFDKSKVRRFIPDALMEINGQMPQTNFTEDSYPYGADDADVLLSQGILVATIRHLMRAYTEQPDITNSQVGFLDRKRYQQAWKAIYDIELAIFMRWLALYKRRLYNLGSGRLLVASKAGRLLNAPSRARAAGRGYW